MDQSFTELNWYGHGPRETYIDRNYELIGQFTSTVDKMFTAYSRPQEYGNISGVRKASLTNKAGLGLEVVASADAPVSVSARRYSSHDLNAFKYK